MTNSMMTHFKSTWIYSGWRRVIITQILCSGVFDGRSSFTAAYVRGCRKFHHFQSRSGPRMERNYQSLPFRWIVVLIVVCTHTENLLAFTRGPNNPHIHSASLSRLQPFSTEAKKSPVSDPPNDPPSVLVRCHSDSMELVVQADLFNRGLQVDGRHLHLGWSSAAEGSVCRAAPSGETEFIIWVYLMDCGMKLSVSIVAFAGLYKWL